MFYKNMSLYFSLHLSGNAFYKGIKGTSNIKFETFRTSRKQMDKNSVSSLFIVSSRTCNGYFGSIMEVRDFGFQRSLPCTIFWSLFLGLHEHFHPGPFSGNLWPKSMAGRYSVISENLGKMENIN